jgi:hypothetical protein
LLRAFIFVKESYIIDNPAAIENTPITFTAAFTFVARTNDFDDVFACTAMLSGKKIEEVPDIAIAKIRLPARGPYCLGETQIAALLAQLQSVATCPGKFPARDNDGIFRSRPGVTSTTATWRWVTALMDGIGTDSNGTAAGNSRGPKTMKRPRLSTVVAHGGI